MLTVRAHRWRRAAVVFFSLVQDLNFVIPRSLESWHHFANSTFNMAATGTICHLLALPAELRIAIYEHCFSTKENFRTIVDWDINPNHPYRKALALTRTCRQLRQETLPLIHRSICLEFSCHAERRPRLEGWMSAQGADVFASISRFSLADFHGKWPSCQCELVVALNDLPDPVQYSQRCQRLPTQPTFKEFRDKDLRSMTRVVSALREQDSRKILTKSAFKRLWNSAVLEGFSYGFQSLLGRLHIQD